MKRGVIYLAIGQDHYKEALRSAESLKKHMPDLPIFLKTDIRGQEENRCFDEKEYVRAETYDRSYNLNLMRASPFEETLWLDTDTIVCGNLSDAFDLLQRLDLAAIPSQNYSPIFRKEGAPPSFPQYNAGVIFFRTNQKTKDFFDRWIHYHEADLAQGPAKLYPPSDHHKTFVHNQPSLRQALYESDLRIATLPLEYNCRLGWAGALSGKVYILHGTYPNLAVLAKQINASTGKRIYYMRGRKLIIKPGKLQRWIQSRLTGLSA